MDPAMALKMVRYKQMGAIISPPSGAPECTIRLVRLLSNLAEEHGL
jgi:hypothetical protein